MPIDSINSQYSAKIDNNDSETSSLNVNNIYICERISPVGEAEQSETEKQLIRIVQALSGYLKD